MKSIKLSEFIGLKHPKPFICGAFLSRIMEETIGQNHYFYNYSTYKASTKIYRDQFDFQSYPYAYARKLDKASGYDNWIVMRATDKIAELRFYIKVDVPNFTKRHLYNYLYKESTTSDWAFEEGQTEEKKAFIRGFAELRGSVDTTARFLAQDYFYENKRELKKSQILIDQMELPIHFANFNARDLQPDFVSGRVKRNTQFRINIYYYADQIGFMNEYKALIFTTAYQTFSSREKDGVLYYTSSYSIPSKRSRNSSFINYLNYFSDNIYSKELSDAEIDRLRRELGFNTDNEPVQRRSAKLITLFNRTQPNVCGCCGTEHTFLTKTGTQYFEVHHVIPYANDGKELDNFMNLVKLCPTCHRLMTSGTKEEQVKAIRKILEGNEDIYDFTSEYLEIEDKDKLAEKIQTMLK